MKFARRVVASLHPRLSFWVEEISHALLEAVSMTDYGELFEGSRNFLEVDLCELEGAISERLRGLGVWLSAQAVVLGALLLNSSMVLKFHP